MALNIRIDNPGLIPVFLRFAVAGAIGTLLQYLVLIVLVQLLNAEPVPASALGYALSALVNYWLNHRYTFRSRKRHRDVFGKFLLVSLSGLGLNTLLMWIGITFMGLHYLLSQILTTALVLIWNFSVNALWSFAEAESGNSRNP